MFWNLGNWCRSRFNKCPLPEKLQRFEPHIKYEIDRDHEKIGDKPQFNNYFINVVKNLGAHVFNMWIARRKASILTRPYLKRSKSRHASMIIVTLWLLLVREGTDMFDKLLVTKLVKMTHVPDTYHGQYLRFCGEQLWTETPKKRSPPLEQGCPCVVCACVCVYHVGQENISKPQGVPASKLIWSQATETKLATPKAGGCATYEVSLLQFWIGCMIHTATQARIKNYGKAPAVRVKHFMSCSYKDLYILGENPQRSQSGNLYSWTGQENWECWRLLHEVYMWMGTRKISFWGGRQWFWWSRPHGFCWRIFLFSQWSLFILWPQHLHGCPNGHWCAQPASCSFTAFWHEMEGKTCLCSSSQEDSTKGKKEGYSEIEQAQGQGFGDGPLLDESWNNRVVDQRGHKTPTLAMGTPQLCQQGNGDRRNDERILLEG